MANEKEQGGQGQQGQQEHYETRRGDLWHTLYERAASLPSGGPMMSYRQFMMDFIKAMHMEAHGGRAYEPREQRAEQASGSIHQGNQDVRMVDNPPMVVGGQVGPGVIMIPPADQTPTHPVTMTTGEPLPGGATFIPGGPTGQVGALHIPPQNQNQPQRAQPANLVGDTTVQQRPAGAQVPPNAPEGDNRVPTENRPTHQTEATPPPGGPVGGGTHAENLPTGGTVDVSNNSRGTQNVGPGEQSDAVRHAEDNAFHNRDK